MDCIFRKNNLGNWAFALGIAGPFCCGPFASVAAIIFGQQSKKAAAQGRATNGSAGSVGFVLGIIWIAFFIAFYLIFYFYHASQSDANARSSPSASYEEGPFVVYDIGMTWDDAKAYCEKRGTHLASVTSQTKQDSVVNVMSRGTKESYWLGGQETNGDWSWITTEDFDYTNWDWGEPNGSGDRLQIYNRPGHAWDDTTGTGDEGGGIKYPEIGTICESP